MPLSFPNALTEEEEILKQKLALLRKKKKQLQALKAAKPEVQQKTPEPGIKRPAESAGEATEQAKKLVQSGAIKVGSGSKEKMGFKRSKLFPDKKKEMDKHSSLGFQPFSSSHSGEEDDEKLESPKPRPLKGLYQSFVSSSGEGRRDRDRDDYRDRNRERERDHDYPTKGNTVYVHGLGVTEDILKKTFSKFGKIININMERERSNGFITFEKMESADEAITEMHGAVIQNIQLKVMLARRQPTFESLQDASTASWATIAASNSQKGPTRKENRDVVRYDDADDIF